MRRRAARGEISREALAQAEDAAVAEAVTLQARVGLRLATDGEFRRRSYHSYFYAQLGDVTPDWTAENEAQGHGRAAQPRAVINSKLRWTKSIHLCDFRLVQSSPRAFRCACTSGSPNLAKAVSSI